MIHLSFFKGPSWKSVQHACHHLIPRTPWHIAITYKRGHTMSILDKEGRRFELKAMKFTPHQSMSQFRRQIHDLWKSVSGKNCVQALCPMPLSCWHLYIDMLILLINPAWVTHQLSLHHCPKDVWKGHHALHASCILSINWVTECSPQCDSSGGHLMCKHYMMSLISEHCCEQIYIWNKDFNKVRRVVPAIQSSLRCSS